MERYAGTPARGGHEGDDGAPVKVAVVGAGVAGLSCAYALSREPGRFDVTVFEAGAHFGGHANTVDVTLDGRTHGVDTGFLVFNRRTYPNLVDLLRELDVPSAASDMSFSVQLTDRKLAWAGTDLNSVFAQRRNLLKPAFWRMLADIVRFNALATRLASSPGTGAAAAVEADALAEPLGEFLRRHRFSASFRDWYLLPMVGAIWSCSTRQMLTFPVGTLVRFCHNHGLLQIADRPQWYTVQGGSREYVRRIVARLADARSGTPVLSVTRGAGRRAVAVRTAQGVTHFDHVVMACHSDQALALLADSSAQERAVLGAIAYAPNRAVLHTDATLLPPVRAQASWNYEGQSTSDDSTRMCVHYLINRLQPLPFKTQVIVSLNPLREPRRDTVLGEFAYSHPLFDLAAGVAQASLPQLQGVRATWFCGAWTGYGFHEDGLKSGLLAAAGIVGTGVARHGLAGDASARQGGDA